MEMFHPTFVAIEALPQSVHQKIRIQFFPAEGFAKHLNLDFAQLVWVCVGEAL
jgi:hypothetical protein